MKRAPQPDGPRTLACVQGAFYLATGVWPLVHMRSFEAVTGPKADRWLVKTVGALVGVLGGALLGSARQGGPSRDLGTVAAGSALALAVVYVSKGRIAPVYLLDAAAELGLVGCWAVLLRRRRPGMK